jgi:hypothetical protein
MATRIGNRTRRIEVISRIQAMYSKGTSSDDSRLSARHVYSKIKTARSYLLKKELERRKSPHTISEWNIQTIPCVSMLLVPPHECPCVPPVGCKILRSECPIPKPIQSNLTGPYLTDVTSLDGSIIFTATTWSRKKYRSADKYTASQPDYFLRDEYLYITVNTDLEVISLSGVFEDPDEVERFAEVCTCAECKSPIITCQPHYDRWLKMDEYLIEPLVSLAMKELLMLGSFIQDNTNDANDNTTHAKK